MPKLEQVLHWKFTAVRSVPPIDGLNFAPIVSGTLRGSGVEATLASPGGDRMRILADGTMMPDVSVFMCTEGGAAIGMDYYGIIAAPPNPDPDWPIRVAIRFVASDPDLLWLTRAVFIGAGRVISMKEEQVEAEYEIFRVR